MKLYTLFCFNTVKLQICCCIPINVCTSDANSYILLIIFNREKLRLSGNKYKELSDQVEKVFPTKYKLDQLADDMKLPLTDFMHGKKTNFSENLSKTLERLFVSMDYKPNEDSQFSVRLAAGFDGSGSHIQRGGKKARVNTVNKILG